jgi:hypothetical protein
MLMPRLSDVVFTQGDDLADSASSGTRGWRLAEGFTVRTLAGNDRIDGRHQRQGFSTKPRRGLSNLGTILTGVGNDIISGSTAATRGTENAGIGNSGILKTQAGNDRIIGLGGRKGIINSGRITTGEGADWIEGSGSQFSILNQGEIDTRSGRDTIKGSLKNFGRIHTANGNDQILGGVINRGQLFTGHGDDVIGSAERGVLSGKTGDLDTGNGNDTIYLSGKNWGRIRLGDGKDRMIGFASGSSAKGLRGVNHGGRGKDKLLLASGIYRIEAGTVTWKARIDDSGKVVRPKGTLTSFGTMRVHSFEKIGGIKRGLFDFADGKLLVRDGIGVSLS